MKPKFLASAVAAATALITAAPAFAAGALDAELASAAHQPGQLLVQYRRGADRGMQTEARSRIGAERIERVLSAGERSDGHGDLEVVRVPPGLGLAQAIERLGRDPAVEFAEPNWIYQHDAVSNDPYYTNGSLWGMYGDATSPANQFGSQAGEAWAAGHTNCASVYVGIIDEGYMYAHEDLSANAGTVPGEIAGNGIDDNGNGYVDDVYGWDFDRDDKSVFDGTQDDHGTHVAGTIGGAGGNGKGVAGVCWSVKLLDAKFLGNAGGSTDNAIRAVDYFVDLKTNRNVNVVALNNSWGGGGFSQALRDAIERANAAGILFVAAAGNDGVNNDTSPHYPSSYDNANVIAVASITSGGALSSFSNYGLTSVDIGAPGSAINSTLPKKSKGLVISGYGSYSGTSMATPHVTGAVALYAANHPSATAAQIKAAILSAGSATPSLNGKTVSGKRLNVGGF